MKRRRLLASLAGACGTALGGGVAALTVGTDQVAASARRRAPSEVRMQALPTPATVAGRTEETVSVAVADVDDVTGRIVGERREAGTDTLLGRVEGPPVGEVAGIVTLEFDRPPLNDRWYYAVGVESETGSRRLCESDPLRASGGGVVPTPLADAPEPGRFDHGRLGVEEGRYELTHVWRDDDGTHWRVEYALAKSAYERARGRARGYVGSFADASVNRYAGHLGEVISREARPVDDQRLGRGLDDAEAFSLAVRYVQSIQYALDSETKGTHDYHRTVEETLVDCLADCKDATYLLSGILSQEPFGYETALVFQANHVLLGVRGEDLPGEYDDAGRLSALDGEYVPIETTARWPIGAYPDRPVVAIFDGERWPYVNGEALGPTLETQIDQFRTHYG